MKITVILCTFNRSQSLAKALDSVVSSVLPSSVAWEVLVVDNNSNDQTREVVEERITRHPGRLRYLFEPKPGKSNALNAGIRSAQSDILAFIDDDVIVEPTWLQNLTTSLASDNWVGSGGRILPQWTSKPPDWLPVEDRYGLAPLAMFDLGPEAGSLNEAPFGTNMAFRKSAFEKFGGFRTDLGPRPGSEIRNEDTEFGQRLLNAGERLRYEPSAVVYHSVSEERLRQTYFLKWWFDKARADVRQLGLPDHRWTVAGVPLVLFRRFAVWTVRWMFAINPGHRFSCKLKVWGIVGQVQESYRASRQEEKLQGIAAGS
jgi:glucosyl-dolichyl phosphate glucuronosyltransferase